MGQKGQKGPLGQMGLLGPYMATDPHLYRFKDRDPARDPAWALLGPKGPIWPNRPKMAYLGHIGHMTPWETPK